MMVVFGVATAEAANPAEISVTVTVTADALSVAVDTPDWAAGDLAEGQLAVVPSSLPMTLTTVLKLLA